MWRLALLSVLALVQLGGCDSKPACAQLRAAMCVRGVDSPMVPVLCNAGKAMAREASNDDCTEVLTTLDLSSLTDAPRTGAVNPGLHPAPAPEAPAPMDGGSD
jgi:hypothetical protein